MQAEEAPSTRLAAAALQAAAQAEEAAAAAGDGGEQPALDRLPPAIAALLSRRTYAGRCLGTAASLSVKRMCGVLQHGVQAAVRRCSWRMGGNMRTGQSCTAEGGRCIDPIPAPRRQPGRQGQHWAACMRSWAHTSVFPM